MFPGSKVVLISVIQGNIYIWSFGGFANTIKKVYIWRDKINNPPGVYRITSKFAKRHPLIHSTTDMLITFILLNHNTCPQNWQSNHLGKQGRHGKDSNVQQSCVRIRHWWPRNIFKINYQLVLVIAILPQEPINPLEGCRCCNSTKRSIVQRIRCNVRTPC